MPCRLLAATAVTAAILCGTVLSGAGPGAAADQSTMNYVALGDSYSAGDGAGSYDPASGDCHRSREAFPAHWANDYAPASFEFAACSGATTADVLSKQVSALSKTTNIVSITIGASDLGFAAVLQTCVLDRGTTGCLNAIGASEQTLASQLPARLDKVLARIRAIAPAARVVVLGYPGFFDAASPACGKLGSTVTAKMAAANLAAARLDSAIAAAASRARDPYADVRAGFAGHLLCDPAPWLTSVNVPIEGSFHPTAEGQAAYEQAFAVALRA